MTTALVRKMCTLLFPADTTARLSGYEYEPRSYKNTIHLLSYRHVPVQQLIKNNKYHRDEQAATQLASVLDRYLARFNTVTVIPVPQSYTRWRERGFDHLLEILTHSEHQNAVRTDLLKKSVHTKRQAHVAKSERLRQQANTFTCTTTASDLSGTIILLDDVVTTGATMQAAQNALQPHLQPDAKLICLALAH